MSILDNRIGKKSKNIKTESLKKDLYKDKDKKVIFDSWEVIDNNIIVKTTDRSFFEYNESGIPKDTRTFWGISNLEYGLKYKIEILYQDNKYDAYFKREIKEPLELN